MPSLTDVTVIVPTRNEAANIARCLCSLPEVIPLIVVDKSSDATRELVRRIRWRLARAGFRCRFDARLAVWATDHRRLRRGLLVKTMHTLLRCGLLYFELLPRRWRRHDWGYWSETRS
jgi:hypothetical protein